MMMKEIYLEEIAQWDITAKYSCEYMNKAHMQQLLCVICSKCYADHQFSSSYLVQHIITLVKANGWTLQNGKPVCVRCNSIHNTDTLESEAVSIE